MTVQRPDHPLRLALAALVIIIAAPAAAAGPPPTHDLAGRPGAITDGDTFRLGETRVRLQGVDAPEMSTPHGEPARRHLAALIADGEVRCRDTGERSYRRIVAVCWSREGRDLAAAMVEAGWAVDWAKYSGGRYAAAERQARKAGRGMHAG